MRQNKDSEQKMYDQLWKCGNIQSPTIWSLWEITKNFKGKRNLELGAGNCPRIPIEDGYFLDTSAEAVKKLEKSRGKSVVGDAVALPFKDNFFDLVAAFEVLEHVEDHKKAFSEIARVLKPGGFLIFSVPLRQEIFNELDRIAGHKRRYEIAELKKQLLKNNFRILKYRAAGHYIKLLNKLKDLSLITKMARKAGVKNSLEIFNLPGFIFNLHYKILSFLERKGAPRWQTDLNNLSEYKEKWIVMFCQKYR